MGRMGELRAAGQEKLRRFVRAVVIFAIGFGGGAVWMGSRDVDLPSLAKVGHEKPALESRLGFFAGTIELENEASKEARVLVTVQVYDGDRKVATLAGRAELEAGSTEELTLRSKDRYDDFTETKVTVVPLP